MESIKIEFHSSIREKLMALLAVFSKDDLQIITDENASIAQLEFDVYKNRLHEESKKIESGESQLYDIDEIDALLDKTISEYEG